MRFSGTERIPGASRARLGLLDRPQSVAQCVPDVEGLEVIDPSRFKAQVKAGIGPVRGKFGFDVAWKELTEPSRARMTAQGKSGGSAVTVDSTMDLADAGEDATDLTWSADVVAHGLIASVGARLLDGFAKKQTEQFFGCIREKVTGERVERSRSGEVEVDEVEKSTQCAKSSKNSCHPVHPATLHPSPNPPHHPITSGPASGCARIDLLISFQRRRSSAAMNGLERRSAAAISRCSLR